MGIVAVSCRQIAGISDSPPTDLAPETTACGVEYGMSTCASCVAANCCAASSACAGSDACRSYYDCAGGCASGDFACRAQCAVDHPNWTTATEAAPLTACISAKCNNACGLPCGSDLLKPTPPDAAAGCARCVVDNACGALHTCTSSVGCVDWFQCTADCSTPDCRGACAIREGYADGGSAAFALASPPPLAGLLSCGAACPTESPWGCVGHVHWPGVTTSATVLTTQVVDIAHNGQPVPQAEVSLCPFLNQGGDCGLATGQTDGNGFVALHVPASATLLPVLGPESYVQITAPGYVPWLYFLGYPVSAPLAPIAEPYALVGDAASVQAVFEASGQHWDMQLGVVSFEVLDCGGNSATSPVEVTIDSTYPAVREYYVQQSGADSFTATATSPQSPFGASGGFINVPLGVVSLTATPVGMATPSSRVQVLSRAGSVSTIFMFPTP